MPGRVANYSININQEEDLTKSIWTELNVSRPNKNLTGTGRKSCLAQELIFQLGAVRICLRAWPPFNFISDEEKQSSRHRAGPTPDAAAGCDRGLSIEARRLIALVNLAHQIRNIDMARQSLQLGTVGWAGRIELSRQPRVLYE